jgi:cellulose synthase/poly-beta-1,6-N-acetylglucosamine synthase-like glycosyltransferase
VSTFAADALLLVCLLLLLPAAVVFAEVALALAPRRVTQPRSRVPALTRPSVAILVPAHNEAAGILATLRSLHPQLQARDRLIVIADNCTDQTAQLAAAQGAEVVTRTDLIRHGKGYALDAGIGHLKRSGVTPQVVLVIDADSDAGGCLVDRLARRCVELDRPVQAKYLMLAPSNASFRTRIAAFAWTVKNDLRPSGLHRLGLPCQLMGTGMAFPWDCIAGATLSTGHIVEDLKLGIDLARRGYPTIFCPEAVVTSKFPSSAEGISSQRARWEHGHLSVILHDAPGLLWQALRQHDAGLLALGLDLCVPPLALLALAMLSACLAGVLLTVYASRTAPLLFALVAPAMLAATVFLSWSRAARRIASLGTVALFAIYAIWKLPLYLRFFIARQTQWVRSRRDGEPVLKSVEP